jgi:hypothetical protein
MNGETAQLNFLRWLSTADPAIFAEVTRQARSARGLGSLGWINFVVQAVAMVGSAVMAKKQQSKQTALAKKSIAADQAAQEAARRDAMKIALLDINTKRAQAGLSPVDESGRVIGPAQLPPVPASLAPYYPPGTPVANNNLYWILGGVGLLGAAIVIRSRS